MATRLIWGERRNTVRSRLRGPSACSLALGAVLLVLLAASIAWADCTGTEGCSGNCASSFTCPSGYKNDCGAGVCCYCCSVCHYDQKPCADIWDNGSLVGEDYPDCAVYSCYQGVGCNYWRTGFVTTCDCAHYF
jgi:hypothetical protein